MIIFICQMVKNENLSAKNVNLGLGGRGDDSSKHEKVRYVL